MIRKCHACGKDLNSFGGCDDCGRARQSYSPYVKKQDPTYVQYRSNAIVNFGDTAKKHFAKFDDMSKNWTTEDFKKYFFDNFKTVLEKQKVVY